ncbi:TPA: ADP-ribosylglycohydrolase family protein [Salmonella enterica subsp. enterica serovar Eastbourne]
MVPNESIPYNSYGNVSAIRISPVAWVCNTLADIGLYIVERYTQISAEVTHNHPKGIKGACATASAIF